LIRPDPRSNDLQSNQNISTIWKKTHVNWPDTIRSWLDPTLPDFFQKIKLTRPVRPKLKPDSTRPAQLPPLTVILGSPPKGTILPAEMKIFRRCGSFNLCSPIIFNGYDLIIINRTRVSKFVFRFSTTVVIFLWRSPQRSPRQRGCSFKVCWI
jgi:hypothetical protein